MAENDEARGAEQSLKDGATQIKESAAQLAEQQKKSGARQLSGIAGAVHAAADQLEQQLPGAAGYIHDAAERIDHVASDLRNRNFSDIADSVRRLGQERPLALIRRRGARGLRPDPVPEERAKRRAARRNSERT